MNYKEIVSFINSFNIDENDYNYKFYAKLYEVYNTDNDNDFLIETARESVDDNIEINEDYLLKAIHRLIDRNIAFNEEKALIEILNKESKIYSEKNVLNKHFSKETLKESFSNIFKKDLTPKFILVHINSLAFTQNLLCDLLDDDKCKFCRTYQFCDNYQFCDTYAHLKNKVHIIAHPYVKSDTFAAIITDAERSFKSFMSKSKLSVVTRLTAQTCDIIIESRSDFVVGNPDGIYVISF
jgi:hypothetical protein